MSPRYNAASPVICHCLHVTEHDVLEAVERCEARCIRDLTRETGAGDGCMSCHRALKDYVERQRSS